MDRSAYIHWGTDVRAAHDVQLAFENNETSADRRVVRRAALVLSFHQQTIGGGTSRSTTSLTPGRGAHLE